MQLEKSEMLSLGYAVTNSTMQCMPLQIRIMYVPWFASKADIDDRQNAVGTQRSAGRHLAALFRFDQEERHPAAEHDHCQRHVNLEKIIMPSF